MDCHPHLIGEKPRCQRHSAARENELAMNMGGDMRDGGGNKGNNIFCREIWGVLLIYPLPGGFVALAT